MFFAFTASSNACSDPVKTLGTYVYRSYGWTTRNSGWFSLVPHAQTHSVVVFCQPPLGSVYEDPSGRPSNIELRVLPGEPPVLSGPMKERLWVLRGGSDTEEVISGAGSCESSSF
eukprot:gene25032-1638_t